MAFKIHVLVLLGLLGLMGCAAQNAHSIYEEADELMKEAMKKAGPNDPDASLAFDSLGKGKMELLDARYDVAIRHFRESMRLSKGVLEKKPPPPPPPAPSVPAEVPKPVVSEVRPVETFPEPRPVEPAEKKSLPKEALAKYLAGKKLTEGERPPEKIKTPENLGDELKEGESKSRILVDVPAKTQVETHGELVDKKPVSPDEVVVAPLSPTIKPIPKAENAPGVDDEISKKAQALLAGSLSSKETAAAVKSKGSKRKLPGAVVFSENDPSITTEAMSGLNQTAKFLQENPSMTLVLQGQLAPKEAVTLLQSRFESVKSYLAGKGVPEDQIMLDVDQKRGKSPEFQMFVIEH